MGNLDWIHNQAIAHTVYGIALAAMGILVVFTFVKLFILGSKSDKLEYLKNYKKGQFVIIYLIAIPLYFFGVLLSNKIETRTDVLQKFLESVYAAFNLIKFDFGMGKIREALSDNVYFATVIICYIVTVLNVLLFSASLLWQRFINLCGKVKAAFAKDLYVVVGGNDNNITLLKTIQKSKNKKV